MKEGKSFRENPFTHSYWNYNFDVTEIRSAVITTHTSAIKFISEIVKKGNHLRDPFVYVEDKNLYLLYVGGREQYIDIANLKKIKDE